MNRWLLTLLLALLSASCSRPTTPTRDHVKFSHGPHLHEGQSCTLCHADLASAANDTRHHGMPTEATCRDCHNRRADAGHPEERACAYCHTNPAAPMPYERPSRELVFSHGAHASRTHGNCVSCHGVGASTTTVETFDPRVPDMRGCLGSCHTEDMRELRCSKCHNNLRRYAMDEFSIVRHTPGFGHHHGTEARTQRSLCAQCHEPTFCSQCHAGAPGLPVADLEATSVTRDFVHRGDFMARHPDESRFNTATCTRCHGVEFCDGCHRASGVGGGVGPGATHPPGWLDPASPNGHARAARRNLLSCVSCHESDAVGVCTPCHRVGGVARSPHPPGFRAGIEEQRHAVCLACHEGSP